MKIIRKHCAEGAREALGLTVIIDVFRAFTCEPLFFHFHAREVLLEADPEKATAMKKARPDLVLVGELNEVPIEGADLGNSPTEIVRLGEDYFRGKTVVHRTTAGVTGVAAALDQADEVILGSFVMAAAVCRHIKAGNPPLVTLVAMGDRARNKAPEDEACADYLEHLLSGRPYDPVGAIKEVLFQPTAQKFIKGDKPYLPREDPVFCLQRDLFDFVLIAEKSDNQIRAIKTRA
jgi:2-phosphosulfolactate phosphatase